ncbi:hypothetical protein [Gardnerella vaginalis]|uniref:Uncharacterized protein n=1 Tax=Gardnerella vaginalis TaxID=2702 RepID=A0A135Z567_GARVA|nr:hypothetical protein [Gardnerella vaginalis]KXI16805.1 hypothetical protein HMPREF3230_00849 [Gardnerella vaginalis]
MKEATKYTKARNLLECNQLNTSPRNTRPHETSLAKVIRRKNVKNISDFTNDAIKKAELTKSNEINQNLPIILDTSHLPGPLCMNRLKNLGIFDQLDTQSGFLRKESSTIEGRSKIVKKLLPSNSIACLYTASWIWLGGQFPDSLDILSNGHYRRRPYGHPIHVYTRKIIDNDYVKIGDLFVTTPTRTICDIALTKTESDSENTIRFNTIRTIMENYTINIYDCAKILQDNHHFPSSVAARAWMENIIYSMKKRTSKKAK